MRHPHRHILAAGATAIAVALAGPALAQQQPEAVEPPPQQRFQAQEFSTDQIQSFAEATKQIDQIMRDYQPRIAEADSQEKAVDLHQEAQSEMLKAVEDLGMSVDEYNQIATAAQDDPDLHAKIMERLD